MQSSSRTVVFIRVARSATVSVLVAASVYWMFVAYLTIYGFRESDENKLKEQISLLEQQNGLENPALIDSLVWLANIYLVSDQYDKAEHASERILKIEKQVYGEQSSRLTDSLLQLAYIYDMRGKYDQADMLYEKLLSMEREPGQTKTMARLNGSTASVHAKRDVHQFQLNAAKLKLTNTERELLTRLEEFRGQGNSAAVERLTMRMTKLRVN